MGRSFSWQAGAVLVVTAALLSAGCAGRGNRKPLASAVPAGRGASVRHASTPPDSYYERRAPQYTSAAAAATGYAEPSSSMPSTPSTMAAPLPAPVATPGFVGKQVSIHFTSSSLSLGSGPRRDVVKGKVLSADNEWVVLQVKDEDKPLYIPRTSVMAIQVE